MGVITIDNAGTPRRASREFDCGFDSLGSGIREENLVEKGNKAQQTFCEQAGKNGYIHLDEIGQVARKDLAQRIAQKRMIAADPKHAPSAQEVKIPAAGAIDQILPLAGAKTDVEAKRLQHANHHFVQMLRVQCIAIRFTLRQHGADVEGSAALVGCRFMNPLVSHIQLVARTSKALSGNVTFACPRRSNAWPGLTVMSTQ